MTYADRQLQEMVTHYLTTMEWAEECDGDCERCAEGEECYTLYHEHKDDAVKDCKAFLDSLPNEVAFEIEIDYSQMGHDFWLTRAGHGVGFWDRPEIWGEVWADRLTDACKQFKVS